MKKSRIIFGLTTAIVVVGISFVSCGKKSSDDDSSSTSSDPVASNPAALAYPTSLAISTFPSSTSTTLVLAGTTDATDNTGAAKKSEQDKILSGQADSCLPKVMDQKDQDQTAETCYEFDQEMIYGSRVGGDGKTVTYGTTDGKNSAKEACLVGFARTTVKRIVGQVDRSLALAQMALCQRKKDGETSVPEVGAEIDLAPALRKVIPKGTVNSAKMKRLADASDGNKVFTMSFDTVRPDNVPMIVTFTHSPKNDANTSYSGVMYAQITELETSGSKMSKTRVMSVMYDRSDSSFKYSLRTARFASSLVASAVGTDGQVDFNAGAGSDNNYTGFANSNAAIEGMTAIAFEGNPTTNAGTFSYWQNPGGGYTERARGMLAKMDYDATTGTLSGCAVSGASSNSIRSSIKDSKTLEPTGAFHPFFNNGTQDVSSSCTGFSGPTTDTTGSYYTKTCGSDVRKWYAPAGGGTNGATFVTSQEPSFYTKQCFKQNSSGVYEIDTAKTTGTAGFDLIASADSANKISPPGAPTPGKGVKKQ